jgi:hypothetical protein
MKPTPFRLAFARYKPVARSRSVLQSPGTEDERAAFRRWDASTAVLAQVSQFLTKNEKVKDFWL